MKIQGYAAFQAKASLKELIYEPKKLEAYEVFVKVTHCGICHSDIHLIDNDWTVSRYPFIPGHEVIGEVTAVGALVKHVKLGDRVGVGWQAGCCHICEWCQRGEENLCEESQPTCVRRHGGYADGIVVDSRLTFVIPQAIDSAYAAPLMCAGITVYSPLIRLGVRASMRVGVIGIGGLGHLALQFASACGCEVIAFSTSPEKKKEAQRFGAHQFILSTQEEQMKKVLDSVDILLSVVTVDLDWPVWIDVLRQNGKLVILGASPSDMKISPGVLLSRHKSVIGSNTGGIPMIHEMLSFAARHQIRPQIETMPLSKVNEAIARVRENKARYRMVLTSR
jgi:uncharacterized zinc-type alcohol dehydrogenase-like protein